MTKLVLSNIFRFVVLIVLQILLLNYVNFGGYVIPFVYILAVLMLPTRVGNIPLLLIAFASGVLVDVFCNIPGFHAFCCTLMAFLRILVGNRMLNGPLPAVRPLSPCDDGCLLHRLLPAGGFQLQQFLDYPSGHAARHCGHMGADDALPAVNLFLKEVKP